MPGNGKRLQWERVYGGLRRQIDQGELAPEAALPFEKELEERYGVSRVTVRHALRRLEAEGLITPARGPLGRRVNKYDPLYWNLSKFEVDERRDDPDTGTDEWAADMKAQGRTPRQEVSVDLLVAPTRIAELLEVPARTLLVRRRRLRFADDVPVSIADTWITPETAERTCTVGDQQVRPFWYPTDLTVAGGIVAAIGLIQDFADDTIYVRHATPEEADLLEISAANTSVGEHVRVGYDAAQRPLRVLTSVFPGNRLALKYRLKFRSKEGNVS